MGPQGAAGRRNSSPVAGPSLTVGRSSGVSPEGTIPRGSGGFSAPKVSTEVGWLPPRQEVLSGWWPPPCTRTELLKSQAEEEVDASA